MSVEVTNTRRGQTTRSQTFHVRTDTIVKPSPVADLHRSDSNATCLWLTWEHTDHVHDKVAFVQYLSQWNSSHWHQLETIFFKRGPGKAKICGLTPFTEYTIRVAVKPLPRGKNALDGYRSEWKYIEKVRTDPSVPEVAPEMCAGCFTDVYCERPHCRNVIVYWKHIPWALRRSVIHSYQLDYTALQLTGEEGQQTTAREGEGEGEGGEGGGQGGQRRGVSGNVSTLYPNTSHLLPLRNDSAYSVHLYAVTSDHKVSRNHSTLTLVAKKDKPRGPGSLIVETDFKEDGTWTGHFDLRWTDTGPQSTAGFLVAWCRGNTAVLKCHHEDQNQVQWQEVASSSGQFQVNVSSQGAEKRERPDHYLVGVARQERRPDGTVVSSGLTWAQCYFLKNTGPKALPENVDFSKVFRAGTLRVTWTYRPCTNMAADVYITRFIIYYCVITDAANNRCKGSEQNATARRDARSVLLEDLEQGAYYRVSMAADSQWGTGQRTQPVYSRVLAAQQQEEPRDFTVIGVILAVVIVIVLILIGLCKIRRRFQKNQEKFITSFGDLPSLPPDSAVSFKDRPLPQVPEGTSSTTVVYTPGTGSAAGGGAGDKRQRGGKHKSITSETSLLGHEEAGNDDDSKRRHKSGGGGTGMGTTSERSKLLEDESGTQESSMTVSKYDSDSGADSRYSGEDHDYASVEGGSAEEGCGGGGGGGGSKSDTGSQPGKTGGGGGSVTPDDARESLWNLPQHKPAPTHSPPPLPPPQQQQQSSSGYTPATLVPEVREELSAACAVSSFNQAQGGSDNGNSNSGQPMMQTFNSLTSSNSRAHHQQHHPAQLAVALEPVQTLHALNTLPPSSSSSLHHHPHPHRLQSGSSTGVGGYHPGYEDSVTLPRRLPGSRVKHPPGQRSGRHPLHHRCRPLRQR
ncbi:uncharacterized protein LOC143279843 isoform X2 [Babylonia areolata]|uniref:uncharacterized protein LOC143279843 isoform X2 n=1 Tax=Babylonia areolata TaxID=304850 RepID=UPI003FD425A2